MRPCNPALFRIPERGKNDITVAKWISQNNPPAAWKESIWRNKLKYFVWEIWTAGLLWAERATFSSLYWLPHDGKYWVCGLLTPDQRNLLGVGMINPSHGAPSVCQYKAPLTLSRGLPSIGFTWQEGNIFLSLFEEWKYLNQNLRISPPDFKNTESFFLGSPGEIPLPQHTFCILSSLASYPRNCKMLTIESGPEYPGQCSLARLNPNAAQPAHV